MTKTALSSIRAVQSLVIVAHEALIDALFILNLRTADGSLDAAQVILVGTSRALARGVAAAAGGLIFYVEGTARIVAGKRLHAVATGGAVVDGGIAPSGDLVAGQEAEQRTQSGNGCAEDGEAKLNIGPGQELDVEPAQLDAGGSLQLNEEDQLGNGGGRGTVEGREGVCQPGNWICEQKVSSE